MTSSTTVNRAGTAHPWLLASSIGAVCVAIGLAVGVVIGANIVATSHAGAIERAVPIGNPYVNIHVPSRAQVATSLPTSAPGNPYVNIHVPSRGPAAVLPSSAPGNPYVNIHVPRSAGD